MCGKTHGLYLQFKWTGKGIPRKYCQSCKLKVQAMNDPKIYKMEIIEFESKEKFIGQFNVNTSIFWFEKWDLQERKK